MVEAITLFTFEVMRNFVHFTLTFSGICFFKEQKNRCLVIIPAVARLINLALLVISTAVYVLLRIYAAFGFEYFDVFSDKTSGID